MAKDKDNGKEKETRKFKSVEEEIEFLRAENARLIANKKSNGTGIKVSAKGAVSIYGLQRFPITLYKEQWDRLLNMESDIRAFIKENDDLLATKAQ